MFIFDPIYILFLLPGLALALLATILTRVTFSRYSHYTAKSGFTGAEAARRLLDYQGIRDVKVEMTEGFLSDHYDPTSKTLRLSPDVYEKNSLSAIGVACHEAGHALQHAQHYVPLVWRSALVPVTQIGTNAAYVFLMLGFFVPSLIVFAKLGAILLGLAVLFALVTLPVEWDASARAKKLMVAAGIVSPLEQTSAAAVLNAAFLTYVAAAVSALLTMLYYLYRLGLLGGRSSDE